MKTDPVFMFCLPADILIHTFTREEVQLVKNYPELLPDNIRGILLNEFGHRLFRALENREKFNDVLQKVMDPVPDWTIDLSNTGQHYLKVNAGGQYHTSEGMGEGIISLFFIVDALYDSEDGDVIVIDEPELSLHPTYQRRLAKLLAEYAKNRQIVYATHSPYFVDFRYLSNGAKSPVYTKAMVVLQSLNLVVKQLIA